MRINVENIWDLHNEIFNTKYYIVGSYQAAQWLGTNAFSCIGVIQEYERDNFGTIHTDVSEPENVVNMYVYIVGEQIIRECIMDHEFDTWMNQ